MSSITNLEGSVTTLEDSPSYKRKLSLVESLGEFERELVSKFGGKRVDSRTLRDLLRFAREAISFWSYVGWIPFEPFVEVADDVENNTIVLFADRVPFRRWVEEKARRH